MGKPSENTHEWVEKRLFAVLCAAVAVPMFFIVLAFYFQGYTYLTQTIRQKAETNLASMAMYYQEKIDSFLLDVERSMKLISENNSFEHLSVKENLQVVLDMMDREYDHFIEDLGVIDSRGDHLAYVGPYDLMGKNYREADWFRELMSKDVVISDVFLGYRQVPHLIIAVKVRQGEGFWIFRATVNAFRFSAILDTIRFGKTGDIFIINNQGVLQTRSRMGGNMLDTLTFGVQDYVALTGVEVLEASRSRGDVLLAKARMRVDGWSLVVQQDKGEALDEVRGVRALFLALLTAGTVLLVASLNFTARFLLRKMEGMEAERNLMDEQLIQSQKLASIGQLSAGIAHEINNPLAIIGEEAGWMQDLLKREGIREIQEYDEFSSSLREIVQQAGRCREITHKLLSFARKMDSTIKDIDLNELLDDVVSMREREAALSNITFVKEYQDELPLVYSEPSLLRQVFLNLINNAIDAIKNGGTITVKTGLCPDKRECVVAAVSDSGMGIPQENLDKIFDPFFTTKPPGKGTGLGLSICHGIINKLGGGITVVSQVGQGTTFTVKVPLEPPKKLREYNTVIKDMELITP